MHAFVTGGPGLIDNRLVPLLVQHQEQADASVGHDRNAGNVL